MDSDDFISRYPTLFHMANEANWPSIEQHGLLSTKALCEKLWSLSKAEADHIIHSHRPTALKHKGIIIRDQRPLNESKLVNCLKGSNLKPADWYAILNERVFFGQIETV